MRNPSFPYDKSNHIFTRKCDRGQHFASSAYLICKGTLFGIYGNKVLNDLFYGGIRSLMSRATWQASLFISVGTKGQNGVLCHVHDAWHTDNMNFHGQWCKIKAPVTRYWIRITPDFFSHQIGGAATRRQSNPVWYWSAFKEWSHSTWKVRWSHSTSLSSVL